MIDAPTKSHLVHIHTIVIHKQNLIYNNHKFKYKNKKNQKEFTKKYIINFPFHIIYSTIYTI